MEWTKQPILKPLKSRLSLTDYQYSVIVYVLVAVAGTAIVFAEPSQWDFLREAGAYGYPQWAGNILSIAAIFGGSSFSHTLWEGAKRLGNVNEPDADESVG